MVFPRKLEAEYLHSKHFQLMAARYLPRRVCEPADVKQILDNVLLSAPQTIAQRKLSWAVPLTLLVHQLIKRFDCFCRLQLPAVAKGVVCYNFYHQTEARARHAPMSRYSECQRFGKASRKTTWCTSITYNQVHHGGIQDFHCDICNWQYTFCR